MSEDSQDDKYKDYLASVHSQWSTPDSVISEVVEEGTESGVASKKRIIAGEANEVYDITLDNEKHVIFRAATSGYPNFLQEKWAMDKVKQLKVPVPEIILIKHVIVDGQDRLICLMEKVEGEPLERGEIDFDKLDESERRRLVNQAGEILSRIHSVSTDGFGWIVGEGKAEHGTAGELIDNLVAKRQDLEKMAREEGIEVNDIGRALEIIEGFREQYSKVSPRLNHGDYSHKHFMVKDNQIVAILDWGAVRSDSPIYDFAQWDYWFGEYIPTEWLKEGYTDKSLFDDNFEDFMHMLRLFKGLEILNWYHQQKYQPAIEKAKGKLIKDLNYFK